MIWCSGWRLASAVSNCGGLGLIGAGSLHPDNFRHHIRQCKAATDKPFGVNIPLIYPQMREILDIVLEEGVKIVFTSAGSPKTWTPLLQRNGIKVAHVVSSSTFAKKCEDAGVDAVVAEGFEAGGHNGKEETSTLCLIPMVRKATSLPLLAAGGIGSGESMLAAMALGADGVQIGTRFALSEESSASEAFKRRCLGMAEGETMLMLKKIGPTRLVSNLFFQKVKEAEERGASAEEMRQIVGKGGTKKGILEGDIENGILEIGQNASQFTRIEPVSRIMEEIVTRYNALVDQGFDKL